MLSLRNLGKCPCPLCETPKELLHQLGMKRDRDRRIVKTRKDSPQSEYDIMQARKAIYGKNGYKVNSKHVDDILKESSRVPTIVC